MTAPTESKSTRRPLTVSQKAEAVALWRAGGVTTLDLAAKFKKRPEYFSRLFKSMGIEKGSAIGEAAAAAAEAAVSSTKSEIANVLKNIRDSKNEHFRMQTGLSKLAWSELVRARQAGLDIASLKDVMIVLKLAGEIIGNSRKEIFAALNVEKYERESEFEDLPELTVRELTNEELGKLANQSTDEELGIEDPGAAMMPGAEPEPGDPA